jgi:uncharacterized protein YdaU (DUF1376 family)
MHLSLLEHGVYRQLLDLYYLNECELDANALRLICARSAEEINAAETVLNEFFEKTGSGYKHKRCEAEIEKFRSKSTKAKASADARWSGKQGNDDANAMRTHSEGNANHKPITNNHSIESEALFDEFWLAYPKKKNKGDAMRAFAKLKNKKETLGLILNALQWQKLTYDWTKENGQFIHYPASYLNAQGWLDEQPEVKKKQVNL